MEKQVIMKMNVIIMFEIDPTETLVSRENMENPAVSWVSSFVISVYQIPPPSAKTLRFLRVLRCDMLIWTQANLLLLLMAEQNTTKNGNNKWNLRFLIFILFIVLQIHRRTLTLSLQSLQYNYIFYNTFFFFFFKDKSQQNIKWNKSNVII